MPSIEFINFSDNKSIELDLTKTSKDDIKNVIETIDVKTIYEAQIIFHKEKLDERVLSHFNIKNKKSPDLSKWKNITSKVL